MVPGTPVVTLADLDHVWLRAYINETDIGKIRYDQPATVTTDTYPGKTYKGRVSFISSNAEFTPKSVETHAERVTLVYRIRIDIYNPTHELVPGMPADATLKALAAGQAMSSDARTDCRGRWADQTVCRGCRRGWPELHSQSRRDFRPGRA